jgi:hypothetical protein
MAAMAVTPPLARWCSPRFGRQEVREPGIELGHALFRDGDRELLVGHRLGLGDLRSLAGGLGRSLAGLASLGPLVPVSTPVAASMAVAAMLTAPSRSAATGQEPGEKRVEFREALLGDLDCDLLVLRGSRF